MPLYLVTPDNPKIPAVRLSADDLFDLGNGVAAYLVRHKRLHRAVSFEAAIGDSRGYIAKQGLPKPVAFSVAQDA